MVWWSVQCSDILWSVSPGSDCCWNWILQTHSSNQAAATEQYYQVREKSNFEQFLSNFSTMFARGSKYFQVTWTDKFLPCWVEKYFQKSTFIKLRVFRSSRIAEPPLLDLPPPPSCPPPPYTIESLPEYCQQPPTTSAPAIGSSYLKSDNIWLKMIQDDALDADAL